jgi:hypothetical protein
MAVSPRRFALSSAVLTLSALALWPRELPASIEDQRARLPPAPAPQGCADEVSGVWRAQVYYSRLRDWYRYELRLTRVGDTLSGTILLRGWSGRPDEPEPPRCRPGLRDAMWSEVATGSVGRGPGGIIVQVDAVSWKLERTLCGDASGEYALDHFTGPLDATRQEFTSINRYTFGQGETFEDPTLFRRIDCPPATHAPGAITPRTGVIVQPPAVTIPPPVSSARPRRGFSCSR